MGQGPLAGVRIVELAGIGPAPFCCMLLADMGADILRIDRLTSAGLGVEIDRRYDFLSRSRRSVGVDLKKPEGIGAVLRLVERADMLVEGFRPGVTDRMGLGPDACRARNPKLVYGRMTGWGQDGPMAQAAGHDMNYIALTGALDAIGRAGEPPVPPLNLVGDFGGGSLYLAMGLLAAYIEAQTSGQGQVVDAAMVDGAASLMTLFYGMRGNGQWPGGRGENILDSGAPYYDVYETADGLYVSVAPIEAKFYAEFLERIGLAGADLPDQHDRSGWETLRTRIAEVMKTRSRDEWADLLEGTDACFAAVLSMDEAPDHPHMKARGTFVEVDGAVQPGPAPRFGRTPAAIQRPPSAPGGDTEEALTDWGFGTDEIDALRSAGAIA